MSDARSIALTSRRQLTLFVPVPQRINLDHLRTILDPVQASLISAHVTLCREDEIPTDKLRSIMSRLQTWEEGPVRMKFGSPERFGGHGVLLPCIDGLDQFQRLRECALGHKGLRYHAAHLTLAHQRNPKSPGNTQEALESLPRDLVIQFPSAALIEQKGASPWQLLQDTLLGNPASVA